MAFQENIEHWKRALPQRTAIRILAGQSARRQIRIFSGMEASKQQRDQKRG
ncbi:hypothetical protein [Aquamicrobium soli]|uniref:hypothetical protein n=1 Tax=Aquamicrobium soli TaxID=1811518 RepID=UPI00366EC46B